MFSVYCDDFEKTGISGFGYESFGHLALVIPDEILESMEKHTLEYLKSKYNIHVPSHINNLLNRQYREKII